MKIIDAEELIAKAQHEAEGMTEPFKSNFAVLVEWLIDKVQPIEPKPHWIPCSERLPEICANGFSKLVWTCKRYGDGTMWQSINQYTTNGGGSWLSEALFDDPYERYEVIAWMPLPEPYRERR